MAQRINVEQAREQVTSGEALLVCAYADEAKCDRVRLEGSMSLAQFESQAPALPKNREVIFYCA